MIKLLSPHEANIVRELRLMSLKSDGYAFSSTYDYEDNFDEVFIGRKIAYVTQQPDFGYWGVFEDKRMVGYCQLVRESLPKSNHQVYIYELFIHPDYRRKHLAFNLLTNLIARCEHNPDIKMIRMKVISQNKAAQKLYKQLGFIEYGYLADTIQVTPGEYAGEHLYYLDVS